jgi:hypothetical protein
MERKCHSGRLLQFISETKNQINNIDIILLRIKGNRRPFKFNFPVYSYQEILLTNFRCTFIVVSLSLLHSGRLLQFISENKIKSIIIIKKKMEFSQETQVLVKIENCLIVSLSYNYNTIIILLL